jgi:hypothetical protein
MMKCLHIKLAAGDVMVIKRAMLLNDGCLNASDITVLNKRK